MKAILDSQVLLWVMANDRRMSQKARAFVNNVANELFVSVASLWEIAIKASLGKLGLQVSIGQLARRAKRLNKISVLPIRAKHLDHLSQLGRFHRDPFDRLIIAQSITQQFDVVSSDPLFDPYLRGANVQRIW
jgi:PIN domain nuclease of toxin-antitoxin system